MEQLDLSGIWKYRTDAGDAGIDRKFYMEELDEGDFRLPGSACENGIGTEKHCAEEYSREIMRCPVEKFEYIAPLWLQREIVIPQEWEGKDLRLYLERVNIASSLWLDEIQIGRQIIELSAPHIYRLPAGIKAGKHRITLRIDNRDLINMADMASGYSVDTQGIWNGIIGKIELQARERVWPEGLQVYPQEKGIRLRLTTITDRQVPMEERKGRVRISVKTPAGFWMKEKEFDICLWTSRQNDVFFYEMDEESGTGEIQWWSEFAPGLYEVKAELWYGEKEILLGELTQKFGMRRLERRGRHILLNGRRISLRGTIDCAQFPLTGYPPMDQMIWKERMEILKKYGFNHVRFHAWCPPEAAFCAADETGMYLSVEMPMWLNHDISGIELGDDPIHGDYYRKEIFTILDEYGNHPSFLLFSNGNENMGDFALMEQLTVAAKAYDPRHLYTTTSNFDHPAQECEDFFSAFQVRGHRVRLQTNQDKIAADNRLDYREAVEAVELPVISFEVGQYCVYPDTDIIEDYTGNILPVNFEMVRKLLKKKGVYDRRRDYVRASGSLAYKLYKEDVEAAMRTGDMAGFQLLSFSDYTGQSLATIGLLDVFLRDKGIEELPLWTEFCNDVVPLFCSERILSSSNILRGQLSLYDFGHEKIKEPLYRVEIYRKKRGESELFWQCETGKQEIEVSLSQIREATCLSVQVSVDGNGKTYRNRWQVYVMPEECRDTDVDMEKAGSVEIIDTEEKLREIAEKGGRAILDMHCLEHTIKASFIPVFWSPVHFPSARPCGALIKADHPVFDGFTTDEYLDYQWKAPMDHAVALDISPFREKVEPMMELVPNFTDNTPNALLFEARVGAAEILFCGFDLERKDLSTVQLKKSLTEYVASAGFRPENVLLSEEMNDIIGKYFKR